MMKVIVVNESGACLLPLKDLGPKAVVLLLARWSLIDLIDFSADRQ